MASVNWVQSGWFVQAGPARLFRRKKKSFFRLVQENAVGGRDTYRVVFDDPSEDNPDGDMDPVWKNCVLVERGLEPLDWTAEVLDLFDASDDQSRDDYRDAVNSVMPAADANTLRLIGEIQVGNKKEVVIFVLAQNAVKDAQGRPQDLLIVSLSTGFEFLGSLKLMEDGTGHSRPH
jgi:hypothetical protein